MAALSDQFPHEKEEIFQLLCETMKGVSDLGNRLEGLPGDIGEVLENSLASAFSEICSALAHGTGDSLPLAIADLDLAGGCLEAVRVFERLEDDLYLDIRERLLRAHQLLDEMWKDEIQNCGYRRTVKEDRPS